MTEKQFLSGAAHALMHKVLGPKRSCLIAEGAQTSASASFSLSNDGESISAVKSGDVWTISCDRCSAKVVGGYDAKIDDFDWVLV